jgi:hypothetical protein
MHKPAVSHSLEILEQLSLTREEWIEYFKTKQLPQKYELEIEKIKNGQNRVPEKFYNQKFIFPNSAPFVTKL